LPARGLVIVPEGVHFRTLARGLVINSIKGQFHEIWEFLMDIHRKSIVLRSTADIFSNFYVLSSLSYSIKRTSTVKTINLPISCAIGVPLANASKIYRIYRYSTLPDFW
jgi:hypothetical protein